MTEGLFITGARGFIGRHLLEQLGEFPYEFINCLDRRQDQPLSSSSWEKIRFIQGDVGIGETYARYLTGCNTVLHLAAATGKVAKDDYYITNVQGTAELISNCQKAGVRNSLYVSTIAVKYPDKSRYDYAQSKEQAEAIIRNSGLNYAIVRPTIVIGQGSLIWESLSRLAKAPIIPYFGDGATKIQPIHVKDLVSCLISLVDAGLFKNEIYELGGPETISFQDFLGQIHHALTGKRARVINIPYKPLRAVLSILEDRFYNKLPVTVGQLSAFNNDGTIQVNKLFSENFTKMMGIGEMINQQISHQPIIQKDAILERECRVFTHFLVSQNPSGYVIKKYQQAHTNLEVYNVSSAYSFEHFLVRLASKSQILTRVADAYSSLFLKKSLLRRKLILLLAILESSPPYYQQFEAPDSTNKVGVILKLGYRGLIFLAAFFLGLILVLPAKLIFSLRAKSAAKMGESWAR